MTRHYIIPIFVPHFGCPHDCVFCNQKKITGLSTDVTEKQVSETINDYLSTFKADSFIEVAFFGGSFTAIDIEMQKKLLAIPREFKKNGLINGIRLSTRPDAIDESILSMLSEYLVDTIELGVQSMDEEVLTISERGHTSSDVYYSSMQILSHGFKLGLQIMIGLPGDTREKSILTALKVLNLNPDFIRIYPTLVIKGTSLEKMYLDGRYKPLTIEEAVEISSEILMQAIAKDVDVIRIGLQPTENIQVGKDVVAGPFHPSIRQLVESKLLLKILTDKLDDLYGLNDKDCTMYCNSNYTSIVSGQKGITKLQIVNLLRLSKLRILEESLEDRVIRLEAEEFSAVIDIKDIIKKIVN